MIVKLLTDTADEEWNAEPCASLEHSPAMEASRNDEQKDEDNRSRNRWYIIPKIITIMRFELSHTAE
jgi:hypothetical protein